jgi:hypothetical protein
MNLTAVVNETAKFLASEWRTVVKAVGGFFHALVDYAVQAPSNVWAMCAFAAATSILVTLVTLILWPKHDKPPAPVREATDATGVRQLRDQGLDTKEIARRTGMSHDAVATILRARTLARGGHGASMRKTHPTAA